MTYIYDGILEGVQAEEIAECENVTKEEAAKTWFSEVIFEGEGHFGLMPTFHQFVDSIDDEWDLYYDYGADYYFAVNDNMEE
jgi:hypothetical protein